MHVYYMGAWSSCRSEEGLGFPGTGVHYGFEPPGVGSLKSGALQEQHMLSTRDPSLQPPVTGS